MKQSCGLALLLVAWLVCGTSSTAWAKSETNYSASASYNYDRPSNVPADRESSRWATPPCCSLPHGGTARLVDADDALTTPNARSVATNSVDDLFRAPATSINRHGQLTNGAYTIDAAGMAPHKTGSLASGKSQWWSRVDAERATLDAAAYADANTLWVGPKAKVPATNGTVGVLGRTGEPTEWINVYRNTNGFVHGAPGGAG